MHAQLTELMGLKGSVGKRCIVMGLISSQEDGHLTLEHEGATVPIDVSHAKLHEGLVTGNSTTIKYSLHQEMINFVPISVLSETRLLSISYIIASLSYA